MQSVKLLQHFRSVFILVSRPERILILVPIVCWESSSANECCKRCRTGRVEMG
jgi:hypothetical protein